MATCLFPALDRFRIAGIGAFRRIVFFSFSETPRESPPGFNSSYLSFLSENTRSGVSRAFENFPGATQTLYLDRTI